MKKNVLILGSGGREHALAWKASQSSALGRLYVAPGNAGIGQVATCVDVSTTDVEQVSTLITEREIDIVVVGPEAPLVAGIADEIVHRHPSCIVIGPSAQGAMLEGSKDFAKQFMQTHHIPTARYQTIDLHNIEEGKTFLETLSPPYVLKADGLAAGKGVLILSDLEEAQSKLEQMIRDKMFGESSRQVVIEEYLHGIEMSLFVLTDGVNYQILPTAKDYKRIGVGDTGPNTGGMGAVSPPPFVTPELEQKLEERVVLPTIEGLKKDNMDYKGFIFIGLMICDGEPYVIEYNVRMGDPESQVVFPRMKTDLINLFEHVGDQTLDQTLDAASVDCVDDVALTVVMAADGYPASYPKGLPIKDVDKAEEAIVFHSGTALSGDKELVSAGGRVLAITALGGSIEQAQSRAYRAISMIDFAQSYHRTDIGDDLLSL